MFDISKTVENHIFKSSVNNFNQYSSNSKIRGKQSNLQTILLTGFKKRLCR
jgi:hypothetical protein